eukprot:TRINITY_DN1342_c0_g1_i3.p1 TRINITY_DN1342_c0_g1~~TRINITY_DN1342_c0_g1_i3.p1  ORF type:complete len:321 (+),score=81.27 TRINITY_DN1342_c0_g1_i3:128-964(+)
MEPFTSHHHSQYNNHNLHMNNNNNNNGFYHSDLGGRGGIGIGGGGGMDIPTNVNARYHRSSLRESQESLSSEREEREEQRIGVIWALLAAYLPEDVRSIEKFFVQHVEYTLARGRGNLNMSGAYHALAMSVRDRLVERWKDTQLFFKEKGVKRVAYLSMEYLIGRSLQNSIVNLGLEDNFSQAMRNLGYVLEDLYDEEQDAGLGNSGLGRLAACFLDSLATNDYPAWGYGIRYKYGMFSQKNHKSLSNGRCGQLAFSWKSVGSGKVGHNVSCSLLWNL